MIELVIPANAGIHRAFQGARDAPLRIGMQLLTELLECTWQFHGQVVGVTFAPPEKQSLTSDVWYFKQVGGDLFAEQLGAECCEVISPC